MAKFGAVFILMALSVDALTNQQKWEKFKINYKKNYNSSEENIRYAIFQDNLVKIEYHNQKFDTGLSSYKLGITQFADLSQSEFVNKLTWNSSLVVSKRNVTEVNDVNTKIPAEIDWSKLGAVTPVKDQKDCGSCWSFSATGSLEGQYFIKNNKLVSLSEQNLMDCSYEYGNHGCGGGLMNNAFEYVRDVGIMTEDSYPYSAIDTACAFEPSESVLKISSFIDLKSGSESQLKAAIATLGPISVAVDALDFALYAEGILDDDKCCNKELCLSHGVLAVGYGTTDDGTDYWLVKNSWGTSWGEDGFIRMSRNKNNQCGIATNPSYPVI